MTRAYLRLDPAFAERKCDYPDGAYAAFVDSLCLAEFQPTRGRFRNVAFLKALLGRRGRWVKFLLDHGDLLEQPDATVYVVGWEEWQEGDWKVGERLARIRNRRSSHGLRRNDGRPRVTEDSVSGATRTGVTGATVSATAGRLTAVASANDINLGSRSGGVGAGESNSGAPLRAPMNGKKDDDAPVVSREVRERYRLEALGRREH